MPLHIKHRPQNLNEVIGNTATVEALRQIIAREDKPHAYLFIGSRGTGKTTLARILAKACGCEDMDFYEYNAANTRGIDTVRYITSMAPLAPRGKSKFYLLDEAHRVTPDAQEALLKLLEDPPRHAYFVLATTNPEKLIDTVKSRCTTFTTKLLLAAEMAELLTSIMVKEHIDATHAELVPHIIKAAEGSPREAVKLLDMVVTCPDMLQAVAIIQRASVAEVPIIELCRRMWGEDSGFNKWIEVKAMLENLELTDAERVRRSLYAYFGAVLLKAKTPAGCKRMSRLMYILSEPLYANGKAGLTWQCYMACMEELPK